MDWIQTLTTILDSLKVGSQNSVLLYSSIFGFAFYGDSSLRLRVPENHSPTCACVFETGLTLCACVCVAWNLPCRPSSLKLAMISPDSVSQGTGITDKSPMPGKENLHAGSHVHGDQECSAAVI